MKFFPAFFSFLVKMAESSDSDVGEIDVDAGENENPSSNLRNPKQNIKATKNLIHSYFDYDATQNMSKCRNCPVSIARRYPTNLKYHLKSKHPDLYKLFEENESTDANKKTKLSVLSSDQTTLHAFVGKSHVLKKGTKKYDIMLRKLAGCFIHNSLPFSLIEDRFFNDALSFISNPNGEVRLELPNRRSFKQITDGMIGEIKSKISKMLDEALHLSFTMSFTISSGIFICLCWHNSPFYNKW